MKYIFFLVTLFVCLTSQAQNKRIWLDAEVEHNFGIGKWFDSPEINDALRKGGSTDIKARFNWRFSKNVGLYSDLSLGIYYYEKGYKADDILNEFSSDKYYPNSSPYMDDYEETGFKMNLGVFYKFRYNKFDLLPRLGIGFEYIFDPYAINTFKEKDSNNKYDVRYQWIPDDEMLLVTSLEFASSYRISKLMSLNFGLSYRYRLTKPKFESTVYDYYSGALIDRKSIMGNNTSTLGVSVGVSFGWGR